MMTKIFSWKVYVTWNMACISKSQVNSCLLFHAFSKKRGPYRPFRVGGSHSAMEEESNYQFDSPTSEVLILLTDKLL